MKILVVGSGAREHALVRALATSKDVESIVCAPGNGGIANDARCEAVRADDVKGIVALAAREASDFAVVGPEAPLVAGLADALTDAGVLTYGPNREAARLEGSKIFAKEFMARHGVPTAGFRVFRDADAAERYVREAGRPLVVKADGLAAGKGVVVANDADEAARAVDDMMRKRAFGDAGAALVVEERLTGEEISFHVLCDGERWVELGAAQDHKRIGDGDTGPNTGGMGAYAPIPILDANLLAQVRREILEPTVRGLTKDGIAFRGTIFFGLMLHEGRANVLEYNVRFGDPECEVLLERLDGELLPLLLATARGDLRGVTVRVRDDAAIAVVMAAAGYPAAPRAGDRIEGLDAAASVPGVHVLHAGTRREGNTIVTAGGRVLTVTASAPTLDDAATKAYDAVDRIRFEGAQYRRDIGWRARRGA